ncbi:MAG: flagellar export protein FliJ [Spirochaetes bacterium]|nr:flagellar export protein FliJ [Spirochaetota bacterium]
MARFSFRLENVLRVRKKMEENTERDFSKKKADLLQVEREIEQTAGHLTRFMRESSKLEGVFTAAEAIGLDNYISREKGRLEGLAVLRSEKQEEVDRSLETLHKARKDRKSIETLKQRLLDRYLYALGREEDNELDDVNGRIALNRELVTIEDLPLEET